MNINTLRERLTPVLKKIRAGFKAACTAIIPKKGDSRNILIRKCSVIAAAAVFIVCTVLIICFALRTAGAKDEFAPVQDLWQSIQPKDENGEESIDFSLLTAENPEIKAWLKSDVCGINYPVCLTTDNTFYLNNNYKKQPSGYGSLFFDCSNQIGGTTQSRNLTIYGHNMIDGMMFGHLLKYKNIDFYKENPTIRLYTPDGAFTYKIFAALVSAAAPEDDNGAIFPFNKFNFSGSNAFNSWIAEARQRSLINTAVEVEPTDNILTLITCCYDYNNARFVVMARRQRSGEDASVDTAAAAANPQPRYPKAWYDKRRAEFPY